MAFTHHSSAFFFKVAVAAGCFGAGLLTAAPANASVLVDPMIRRGGGDAVQSASEPTSNIVELASSTEGFGTLTAALQAANLGSILSGDGPFTVFAPTDAAFMALPPGALDALLKPENRDLLVKVLYNHVGYGDFTSDKLSAGSFETFDGSVNVAVMPTGVTVDGANVVQADVDATNGVIHAVDQVLLPVGFVSQLEARMTSGSSTVSSESSSQVTRATTLQETAIDRSIAPAPMAQPAAAPMAEPAAPVAEPAAAPQQPVRGLW